MNYIESQTGIKFYYIRNITYLFRQIEMKAKGKFPTAIPKSVTARFNRKIDVI